MFPPRRPARISWSWGIKEEEKGVDKACVSVVAIKIIGNGEEEKATYR